LMAQRVADALVEEFHRFSATSAQQQSRRRRVFVQEQLGETENLLQRAQVALSDFRRREGVYSSRELFAAQQAGMLQLDVRREELAADRRMLASLLERVESAEVGGDELDAVLASPVLASSPVVTQLFGQLMEQQMRLDSLRATGAAAINPDVRRYEGLVAATREKLAGAAASHLATLDARIAALDGLKARQRTEIRTLPDLESEEARLAQQVQSLAAAAEQLRAELQRARIAEAVEGGQVQIVDRAALPLEPLGSGRTRKLVFGLILGLMVGGGVAMLRENLNTSIRQKSEMEDSLHLTGLAVIPRVAHGGVGARFRGLLLPGRRTNGRALPTGREMVVAGAEQSAAAEAYRTLRTNLHFSSFEGAIRTIAITSASPDEGKTTTALNLGAAFAQQGRSVALVDADLRKGRLHRVFDLERGPGLVGLLMGEASLDEVVRESGVPGLSVITTDGLPPNPAELLGSRMEGVLAQLRERFDIVVLDTSPVLAASDVSVLGSLVDGVILVVRAGETERGAARAAMEQLRHVEARMLGAVLNDPDAKVPRYGGGYYHYEYYGEKA
ncbi:MAG TPA: polysaccharide biosynthesis tyrosine autokinase, partial [Longimicrobiales bacterium]|nr:polysaccharide biosynthesis tyrosine autokinase [Longimicrobiales bacterium]